jgi:hypothetical protein
MQNPPVFYANSTTAFVASLKVYTQPALAAFQSCRCAMVTLQTVISLACCRAELHLPSRCTTRWSSLEPTLSSFWFHSILSTSQRSPRTCCHSRYASLCQSALCQSALCDNELTNQPTNQSIHTCKFVQVAQSLSYNASEPYELFVRVTIPAMGYTTLVVTPTSVKQVCTVPCDTQKQCCPDLIQVLTFDS